MSPDASGHITVLIAEDQPTVREALAELISDEGSLVLVGAVEDADQAIELAREHQPDVALLDVKMPAGGGPRATREIRAISPETRVVALSAYEDRATVLEMLRAGAAGYLVKGTPAGEILEAIRRSVRGQASLSTEVTADVIHELVALLERSERMARELHDLDRMKSELIQVLTHELMTPITVIQGATTTISSLGGALAPEDAQALASGVERAAYRLRRVVGNVAATARLDRGDVEIQTRPVAAQDVITAAAAEFPLRKDRIRLPSPDEARAELWADLQLASRALVTLLENAFDLTDDGLVKLEVEATGTEVLLKVSDRGPGVPEEFREKIFEAFAQGDSGTTRPHEGLGIGLYLARKVMSAHGGRIEVLPRGGGGSTFVLAFPADPAPT